MKTCSISELLTPGDIFVLKQPPEGSATTFWVTRFTQGLLVVAELDGQQRNDRVVVSPVLPDEFERWPFVLEPERCPSGHIPDLTWALRDHLDTLRYAVQQRMSVHFYGLQASTPFCASETLPDGFLFRRATYPFGRGPIAPYLDQINMSRLGIPSKNGPSCDAPDLLDRQIRTAAQAAGLAVREESVEYAGHSLRGYLSTRTTFGSLEDAHAVVQALVYRTLPHPI